MTNSNADGISKSVYTEIRSLSMPIDHQYGDEYLKEATFDFSHIAQCIYAIDVCISSNLLCVCS